MVWLANYVLGIKPSFEIYIFGMNLSIGTLRARLFG